MIQVPFRYVPFIRILNENSDILINICKENIETKDFLLEILLHGEFRRKGPYHELYGLKKVFQKFPDLLERYKSLLTEEELNKKIIDASIIPDILDKHIKPRESKQRRTIINSDQLMDDFVLSLKEQLSIPDDNEKFFNLNKLTHNHRYIKNTNYHYLCKGYEEFEKVASVLPEGDDGYGWYHTRVEYLFRLALFNGNFPLVKFLLSINMRDIPIMRIIIGNKSLLHSLLKSKSSGVYKFTLAYILWHPQIRGQNLFCFFSHLIPEITGGVHSKYIEKHSPFVLMDFLTDCFREYL